MTGHEIRQRFLDYFQRQGHTVVPSASLIPEDDPTLLFTGAGMNQFKEYFLGRKKDLKRAASCQKCFRTPDLELVGKTASHLTFFEMLGNFSFGDYFKPEAIQWAWEFLTRELKLPSDRLWITVYEQDDEALAIWRDRIKIPAVRMVKLGAKDNFWPSNAPTEGPNGPCGPCSEIHYDYGCCTIGQVCPDPDHCRPGCPCGRFVEVWNLVFTQYDRQSDGSLKPLPAKNIDTGMGLERLTAVVNNSRTRESSRTNFDTDLLKPIVETISGPLKNHPDPLISSSTESRRYDINAIADHIRALTFLIADGVNPSRDGRGHVLRALLRKAEDHGQMIGWSRPFLFRLVPCVIKTMRDGYLDLQQHQQHVIEVIKLEEERYWQNQMEKMKKRPLLEAKLTSSNLVVESLKIGSELSYSRRILQPKIAAEFHDTHGFSYDEIAEVCEDNQVGMPSLEQFEQALAALQVKSKAASRFSGAVFAETLTGQIAALGLTTAFVGDAALEAKSKVVALLQDGRPVEKLSAPASVMVLLDQTPFYGESGGQLGDTGLLEAASGKLIVEDTKRIDQTIVHIARVTEGTVKVQERVRAVVDPARRQQVARNHTATHLLHAALREVLGAHVHQAGSLVAPDRLRFDFTHTEAVHAARLRDIEARVNAWVRDNHSVATQEMPVAQAKASGALAFFGEKYGDRVRVVTINQFSKEFCGGTHLAATGQVGLLTIVDEGSVASGVRRVEALTGETALAHLKGAEEQLLELAQLLRTPREKLGDAVERLRQQARALEAELERLRLAKSRDAAEQLWKLGETLPGGVQVICHEIPDTEMAGLRALYDAWKPQAKGKSVLCLGSRSADGVFLIVGSSQALVQAGCSAKTVIDRLAPIIEGKGGGRPDFAQAGGRNPGRLQEALQQVVPIVKELTS